MPSMHTPDEFKSKPARIVMGFIGLALAYLMATRAIQTGSWLQYGAFFLFLTLGLRQIFKAFK